MPSTGAEVEEILVKSWNLVGRVDEIPHPGDYRVFDLCGQSAIVMRGEDGEIRALANTCRHRGTRLLDDRGNCRAIICPYHAWTYRLDGTLFGCRGMEKTRGFDKEGNGLAPVRLGVWAGFIFVCFSDECPDLETWLGDLPRGIRPLSLRDVRAPCAASTTTSTATGSSTSRTRWRTITRRPCTGARSACRRRTRSRPSASGTPSTWRATAPLPSSPRTPRRSRTSRVWRDGRRPGAPSPSSTPRRSSAPRRTACGGCRRSRTARPGAE